MVTHSNLKLHSQESEERIRQRLAAVLQGIANPVLIFDVKARPFQISLSGRKLASLWEMKLGERLPSGLGYDSLLQHVEQGFTEQYRVRKGTLS